MKKTGWLNVYRSGYFHREGKPSTLDRHAGDFYATRAQALADISPRSHYIDTVPIEWEDPQDVCANCPESKPKPIRESRREFEARAASLGYDTEAAYTQAGLAVGTSG